MKVLWKCVHCTLVATGIIATIIGLVFFVPVQIPLALTQRQADEAALYAPRQDGEHRLRGSTWRMDFGKLGLYTTEYLSITRENGQVWIRRYLLPTLIWQPDTAPWEPDPHPLTQA